MFARFLPVTAAFLLLVSVSDRAAACTTDVTSMGIVGNGVTDNTTALNNLFKTIATVSLNLSPIQPGVIPCRSVYFPQGTYLISGPITINASDINIYGDNRSTSVIQQKTANTAILQWTSETVNGSFGVNMHDLGFYFTTIPTASSVNQWALRFQCSTTVGNGYALNTFERLSITNSYIGIGTPGTGNACGIWSSTFKSLLFVDTQHSAISLITPIGGQPANLIDKIDVLNYPENGIQLQSDGPAIAIYGASGLTCRGVNIEDWYNFAFDLEGGKGTIIDQPRFERLHFTNGGGWGGYPTLFFLGNDDFTMRGLVIESFAETTHSGNASIISVGNGVESGAATLELAGANIAAATLGSGGHIYLFKAPAPLYARINDRGLVFQGPGVVEYPPLSAGNDQYSRVTTDGLPPFVSSLPPASAQYRGRMFTVISAGATGADTTYLCLQTTTGGYAWHAI